MLSDSLITVATNRNVKVRLLISHWAHTSPKIVPYLKAIKLAGDACQSSAAPASPIDCKGTLRIKMFAIPGWNNTGIASEDIYYPTYSRVSHAKYIVTDNRVNIGTSNYEYSYFAQTAGSSFNTDFEPLRQNLESIFRRDWNSDYTNYI